MKHKFLNLAAIAALTSASLFSCTDAENLTNSQDFGGVDGDVTIFNLAVSVPDEIKSRAAANGIVGADGLYSFTREIDRLWYAVYYDGEYLFDSEQEDSPAVTKISDGNFSVPFKFHNTMDFSKINVFFWAGNAEDNVSTNDVTSITDGINLNFAKRCVSVDPKYMNGNNTELKEFDSFSGYVQLTTSSDDKNFNKNITLYRPFAQIHILTDEFTEPGVSSDFPDGVTVVPGFGAETASSSNYSSTIVSPTTWFFDDSVDLNPGYKKNEFQFSTTSYEFTNSLAGNTPERVTFKDRTMDYMGCYYVFAPIVKAPLKLAESTGTPTTLGKVNLAFRKKGESMSNSEFASVDLPSDGIKANNKYVIYNKSLADGGNGGFLSSTFVLEVVTDPIWGDNEEIQYPPEADTIDVTLTIELNDSKEIITRCTGSIGNNFYANLTELPYFECSLNDGLPKNLVLYITYGKKQIQYNILNSNEKNLSSYDDIYTGKNINNGKLTINLTFPIDYDPSEIIFDVLGSKYSSNITFTEKDRYLNSSNSHLECYYYCRKNLAKQNKWNSIETNIKLERQNSQIYILSENEENEIPERTCSFYGSYLSNDDCLKPYKSTSLGSYNIGYSFECGNPMLKYFDQNTIIYKNKDNWNYLFHSTKGEDFSYLNHIYAFDTLPFISFEEKNYYLLDYRVILGGESYYNTENVKLDKLILYIRDQDYNNKLSYYYKNLPIPENGFKPDHSYIYILKENLKLRDNDSSISSDDFCILERSY